MAAVGFQRPRGDRGGPFYLRGSDLFREHACDEGKTETSSQKKEEDDTAGLASFHLNLDETVGDLRERIEVQQGVDISKQELVFRDKVLRDASVTLRELGVVKGSEISPYRVKPTNGALKGGGSCHQHHHHQVFIRSHPSRLSTYRSKGPRCDFFSRGYRLAFAFPPSIFGSFETEETVAIRRREVPVDRSRASELWTARN